MFVSYKWLQDYVDLSGISATELADKITKSGIEVEGVEKKSEGLKGVVIGHVLECEKHPDADKLNKCLVDIGARGTCPNYLWCTQCWERSKSSGCDSWGRLTWKF